MKGKPKRRKGMKEEGRKGRSGWRERWRGKAGRKEEKKERVVGKELESTWHLGTSTKVCQKIKNRGPNHLTSQSDILKK
jgi:hypothetical protein